MAVHWTTDRQLLTEKLRTVNWRKLPQVREDWPETIAETAGLDYSCGSETWDLGTDAQAAIVDVADGRDSGASREEMESLRETRDDALEEFLSHIRKYLLPDVVAAEDAEIARMCREPLTGLGS